MIPSRSPYPVARIQRQPTESERIGRGCRARFRTFQDYPKDLFVLIWQVERTRCGGNQMRAGIVGIAVVVAIGLIWSVAVMSKLVPLDGSEMRWAATSPHVNDQALLIR